MKDYHNDSAAISKRSYPLQELNGSNSLRFTLLKINIDPINACCIAWTHVTLTYMRTIKTLAINEFSLDMCKALFSHIKKTKIANDDFKISFWLV